MARKNNFKKAYVGIVLDMALALPMYANVNVFPGLAGGRIFTFLGARTRQIATFWRNSPFLETGG